MVNNFNLNNLLINAGDMALKRRLKKTLGYLNIKYSDKILDCGCGEGFFLKVIREFSNCRLYGYDHEERGLSIAKREVGDKNIILDKGEIYSMPYPNNYFDKIILSEVLEHLSDEQKALREIKRVLKPGGLLVITVPNHNYPLFWDPINKICELMLGKHFKYGLLGGIWNQHERLYYMDELVSVVQKAGFRISKKEFLLHYCVPFNYHLLHIVKRMMDRNMLPKSMTDVTDKFAYDRRKDRSKNLASIAMQILNMLDNLNDKLRQKESSVIIILKAVK